LTQDLSAPMRLALIIEYEGTKYHGFQYQDNARSIQEEIEKAIARLTGERLRIQGAGRTDAGVHAEGQVAVFDTDALFPPETYVRALNFYLPDDIAIQSAYLVARNFNPRRMAISRRYRYIIHCGPAPSPLKRHTAYDLGRPLDIQRMRKAARRFVGKHDFARFAGSLDPPGRSTVREVFSTSLRKNGETLRFDVEGNSFLPHQVRRMAGALVDVGLKKLTLAEFRLMLEGGTDSVARSLPPNGLCLIEVKYADFPPKAGETDGIVD